MWNRIFKALQVVDSFFERLIFKVILFYVKIRNYIRIQNGWIIIDPQDVTVTTSLVWRGDIAPKGKVFYIAYITFRGKFYHRDLAIRRKNLSDAEDQWLRRKYQVLFAEVLMKKINRK